MRRDGEHLRNLLTHVTFDVQQQTQAAQQSLHLKSIFVFSLARLAREYLIINFIEISSNCATWKIDKASVFISDVTSKFHEKSQNYLPRWQSWKTHPVCVYRITVDLAGKKSDLTNDWVLIKVEYRAFIARSAIQLLLCVSSNGVGRASGWLFWKDKLFDLCFRSKDRVIKAVPLKIATDTNQGLHEKIFLETR